MSIMRASNQRAALRTAAAAADDDDDGGGSGSGDGDGGASHRRPFPQKISCFSPSLARRRRRGRRCRRVDAVPHWGDDATSCQQGHSPPEAEQTRAHPPRISRIVTLSPTRSQEADPALPKQRDEALILAGARAS
jgi:hypothetical protein